MIRPVYYIVVFFEAVHKNDPVRLQHACIQFFFFGVDKGNILFTQSFHHLYRNLIGTAATVGIYVQETVSIISLYPCRVFIYLAVEPIKQ